MFFWNKRPLFLEQTRFRKKTSAFSEKTELFSEKDAHVSYTNLTLAKALVTTREPVNSHNPSKSYPNFPKFPELFMTARYFDKGASVAHDRNAVAVRLWQPADAFKGRHACGIIDQDTCKDEGLLNPQRALREF